MFGISGRYREAGLRFDSNERKVVLFHLRVVLFWFIHKFASVEVLLNVWIC